jgi:hypothetical protein
MLLTPLLFAAVALWVVMSQRSLMRVLAHMLLLATAGSLLLWRLPKPAGKLPGSVENAVSTVTRSVHLDRFDGDFLNWTVNGWDAFSTPVFLACVILTLSLTARQGAVSPPAGLWRRLCEYRAEVLAAIFFVGYMSAPTNVTYPWVAWSIDTRLTAFFGIFLVGVPRFLPGTLSQALRFMPIVLFSFFHMASLVSPFAAFSKATKGLVEVSRGIPPGSKILPVFSHEYMHDGKRWRFVGYHGFVNQHVVRWSAVLSRGVQPFSFCGLPFHPVSCVKTIPVGDARNPMAGIAKHVKHYDYVVFYANVPTKAQEHREIFEKQGFRPIAESGEWSLWVEKSRSAGGRAHGGRRVRPIFEKLGLGTTAE